jgi:hypothetical protein
MDKFVFNKHQAGVGTFHGGKSDLLNEFTEFEQGIVPGMRVVRLECSSSALGMGIS